MDINEMAKVLISKVEEYKSIDPTDAEKITFYEKQIMNHAGVLGRKAFEKGLLYMTIQDIDVCPEIGGSFVKFFKALMTGTVDEFKKWQYIAIQDDYDLCQRWLEAHKSAEAIELEQRAIQSIENIIKHSEAKANVYNLKLTVNNWRNYGKNRTYLAVIETCNGTTHYVKYDFGYIDNAKNTYVPGKWNYNRRYNLSGDKF